MLSIDENARIVSEHGGKPSDESLLHIRIVKERGAGAVLHTHSIWNTILSDLYASEGGVTIEGYEMLKGLQGVRTHEHTEWLPIIENSQDMPALADVVGKTLNEHKDAHGFLLRRHGLYSWGDTLAQAKRHIEILEFLLETMGRTSAHQSKTRGSLGGPSMAVVTILNEDKTLKTHDEIVSGLASHGIDYERWQPAHPVADDAPAEEILQAYSREIDELKIRGGYVTADVIDVNPATPGLDEMLAKFNREHWHDEDEVRFIIAGHGLFHIHSTTGAVLAIEVEAGDLIRVPRGTLHWFNLCARSSHYEQYACFRTKPVGLRTTPTAGLMKVFFRCASAQRIFLQAVTT